MDKSIYQTEHWQNLRWAALCRSNEGRNPKNIYGYCEKCGYMAKKSCLQLHHLTYKNKGNEALEDVILLCPVCHADMHGRKLNIQRKESGA